LVHDHRGSPCLGRWISARRSWCGSRRSSDRAGR
jgi:hypothetical protein